MIHPVIVDFETFAIKPYPYYPPQPVGVSIKYFGEPARYYAWGHPTGNNSTFKEAKKALEAACACEDGVCFHNADFDTAVLSKFFSINLGWERIHDTLFLYYLYNPNAESLALKDIAHKELDMPPEERDAVAEWLVINQPAKGINITTGKAVKYPAGAYIALAPGDLVAEYANGDVIRTEALFNFLYPKIVELGMLRAYDVERELMLILQENSKKGVRIDLVTLRKDIEAYTAIDRKLEAWIKRKIGVNDDFNLNSGHQYVSALVESGLVDKSKLQFTANNKYKSDKTTLDDIIIDKQMLAVRRYTQALNTCLNTFMIPWLEQAELTGGTIHTTWNQTRRGDASSKKGARTGRLSSTPNFMNIPKVFKDLFTDIDWPISYEYKPLPICRKYILPAEEGHVLINRDYSQQEPRIFCHFVGGPLLQKYKENPWIDSYDHIVDYVNSRGIRASRDAIKVIYLGLLYGMGLNLMLASIKSKVGDVVSQDTLKQIRGVVMDSLPGWHDINKDMKWRAKNDKPIRTWLGRLHYCEPASIDPETGAVREYDYKMVNTLIQGSAADCTKVAIIRSYKAMKESNIDARFYVTVHDEIMYSVLETNLYEGMSILRDTMESVEFDIPILSEGKAGSRWDTLRSYDKKGEVIYEV